MSSSRLFPESFGSAHRKVTIEKSVSHDGADSKAGKSTEGENAINFSRTRAKRFADAMSITFPLAGFSC